MESPSKPERLLWAKAFLWRFKTAQPFMAFLKNNRFAECILMWVGGMGKKRERESLSIWVRPFKSCSMVTTSIRLQSPLAGDRDRLKTIRFRHDENKFVFIILSVVEFRGIFACFSSLSAKNIIRNLWPGVISETFKVSYFFQILKTFVLLLN